jgi:hypothetical protein
VRNLQVNCCIEFGAIYNFCIKWEARDLALSVYNCRLSSMITLITTHNVLWAHISIILQGFISDNVYVQVNNENEFSLMLNDVFAQLINGNEFS